MALRSFHFCGLTIVPLRTGRPIKAMKMYTEGQHCHTLLVLSNGNIAWSKPEMFRYAYPAWSHHHAQLARAIKAAGAGNPEIDKYLAGWKEHQAKRDRDDRFESVAAIARKLTPSEWKKCAAAARVANAEAHRERVSINRELNIGAAFKKRGAELKIATD